MEGSAYPGEEEEEEEELLEPPYGRVAHSCSSLIRLEQEAKRRKRAQQQQRRLYTIMPGRQNSDEDVLDLAEYTKNQPWWRKLFGPSSTSNEEKYNVATQLAIGGVTGWCTGFIFQKVGKLAATAVGGGFFLLQLANHTGYIKIDWKMVERDVSKAKKHLKFSGSTSSKLAPEMKSQFDEAVSFLKRNVLLSGGFVGGFLLGMAS
ncbi:FUN14 domain-containing protein 2 [Protobothrops mucrosquamatus]|uniref:FUN14 domain-containing protein 2 n=1 Tax=Protobothrops mucrosquamatus TaxID=103944 RepID=UPI0010FBBB9F|nr:FUN14 domain-containing protein 2 [Protobothrops mucrosquamatus]